MEGEEPAVEEIQSAPSLEGLNYDQLLSERSNLQALLSSKEMELRQLEQMEKRLLDTQGDSGAEVPNAVKDLTDILGDFGAPVLKVTQGLFLQDEVKPLDLHSAGDAFDFEEADEPPHAEATAAQERSSSIPNLPVGLGSVFEQLDDPTFNLMICGPKGVGKTTLFNALFNLHESPEITGKAHISFTETLIREGPLRLRVSCVQADPRNANLILGHVYDQQQDYFSNELKEFLSCAPKRFSDKRIHCCLYLLPPHGGKQIHENDKQVMKQLAERTNVIPLIGKADTLTAAELASYKQRLAEAILAHKIQLFLPHRYKNPASGFPLAIAASTELVEGPSGRVFGRKYPWGTVETENPQHSDFGVLRNLLLRTHFSSLLKATHEKKYGAFKANKIKELEANELNGGEVGKKKAKKRNTIFKSVDKRQSHVF